ncbi:MAG: class I adenylate-forming enzyme family protein [Solirubrobacterales bacterium]
MSAFDETMARWARRQPHRTAVVDDRSRLTYSELDTLVDAIGAALQRAGVGAGDIVSSQLPNCIEALALSLAVTRVGAVHNPMVTIYGRREVDFIRAQARSAVIVDGRDHELLHPDAARATRGAAVPDATRYLLYTSGSTSAPKGVRHSDRTLSTECAAQAGYHGLGGDEVFVMPSPVGHISGLLYGILLPVWIGASSVLMPQWDPAAFLALVEKERGTFCGGATPFLRGVVECPERSRYDVSSLRLFPCGGADVPPELIRAAIRELGIRTGRGYGSTEFPSITSSAGPDEPETKRAETDGRPIGDNEVRIVDGEIQARGPECFLGYQDPSLDADAFSGDGWYRTGDLGTLDADGYLTVTGRLKDVIVRSGEKVSARELEELLGRHPEVLAVAVVALPDARTGERACACVVPRDAGDPPTLEGLGEFLLDLGLSRRKFPEQLALLDGLPTTAAGKFDKPALRARIEAAREGRS